MKLTAILAAIRGSKTRDDLKQIMNAAEARDSKLSSIEGERERARLWAKVEKLGLVAGDMVFIHAEPAVRTKRERYTKPNGKKGYREVKVGSNVHGSLYGQPLTVVAVKTRAKEIRVTMAGGITHNLSPFTCEKLKLSKEPTSAALAAGLQERVTPGQPIHKIKWPTPREIEEQQRKATQRVRSQQRHNMKGVA